MQQESAKITEIIVTGPESSGKTTIAARLAERHNTIWVEEFARKYLQELGRPYTRHDIAEIARGQAAWQAQALGHPQARNFVFVDTDALVCKIWEEVKFGACSPVTETLWRNSKAGLYLLCAPDLPWQYDPLRETPDPMARWALFERYKQALANEHKTFLVLKGGICERVETANIWLSMHSR